MEHFIITFYYWRDTDMVHHSFKLLECSFYSEEEAKAIAEQNLLDDKSKDGYYITKQEILASN